MICRIKVRSYYDIEGFLYWAPSSVPLYSIRCYYIKHYQRHVHVYSVSYRYRLLSVLYKVWPINSLNQIRYWILQNIECLENKTDDRFLLNFHLFWKEPPSNQMLKNITRHNKVNSSGETMSQIWYAHSNLENNPFSF